MSEYTTKTNAARIRLMGSDTDMDALFLTCGECDESILRVNSGDRFDILLSYVKDHIRTCPGHPSGVHYLDRG